MMKKKIHFTCIYMTGLGLKNPIPLCVIANPRGQGHIYANGQNMSLLERK